MLCFAWEAIGVVEYFVKTNGFIFIKSEIVVESILIFSNIVLWAKTKTLILGYG